MFHVKIGTRTAPVSSGFKTAFVKLQTIVDIAGELAHQKESGSLRPGTYPTLIA
jgi:hypothetical protein